MAVAHTTVLELLGKDVSFIHERKVELIDNSFTTIRQNFTGTVTGLVFYLNNEPGICVDGGDFYFFSELLDFKII